MAGKLPLDYFSDRIVDSKELDYAASVKYEWNRSRGGVRSNLKAGGQWKATDNTGRGEYYENPAYAPTGYRPRPYSDYPYMHNLSLYAEEQLRIPVGSTALQLTAGVRLGNLFVRGTRYDRTTTFSPRLNARWRLSEGFTVRGGVEIEALDRLSSQMYPYLYSQSVIRCRVYAAGMMRLGRFDVRAGAEYASGNRTEKSRVADSGAGAGEYPRHLTAYYDLQNEYLTAPRVTVAASVRYNTGGNFTPRPERPRRTDSISSTSAAPTAGAKR